MFRETPQETVPAEAGAGPASALTPRSPSSRWEPVVAQRQHVLAQD